jgi:hypothetical protein
MFVSFLLAIALFAMDAGTYKGTWTGAAAGGDFRLTLRPDGKGGLGADVAFTIEGQEVPCKVTAQKIDGDAIAVTYEFDLQGNKLQSAIKGTAKGKTVEGTYKTTAAGTDSTVDEGSWKTTAQ